MNRIDELIQDLCPKGVEFKKIWEVTYWDKKFNEVENHKQPKTLKYKYLLASQLKELAIEGVTEVKLLSTSERLNLWTTAEKAKEFASEGEIVSIPWGGTATVQYTNGKFATADNRIATSRDKNILGNKYLYYVLLHRIEELQSYYRGSGIQHPSMQKVLDMSIPVPPIEVQQEIVSILDKFTALEAELEAELEARKKQYEYYRAELFSYSESNSKQVSLSEVCTRISSGGTPSRSNSSYFDGTIPWIRTQEVDFNEIFDSQIKISELALKNSSANWIPADTVIVALYGATAGKSAIAKIPVTTNQACCNIEVNKELVSPEFVFHWLMANYQKIKSMGQGTQSNLNSQMIKDLKFPLIPLVDQIRIVGILTNFDEMTKSISKGLPAEIAARRKQYEYYRDKLLTFKELDAA